MLQNLRPFVFMGLVSLFWLSGCMSTPVSNRSTEEGSKESPPTPTPTAELSVAKKEVLALTEQIPVYRYIFKNGLKVMIVEDHTSPTFAYQTWYRVGSKDEVPGKTGLAHLFEHMMFKETKNLKDGEFFRTLEASGSEGENAFTNRDYTAYIQELPKEHLDMIARLESERMVNLMVNDQSFRTEREVVQNERRFRYENNPDGMMYQNIFELAFKEHAYRWPVIGYEQDLNSMSGQDAQAFYRSYYSPNHATIVVVGDVTPKEVISTINKHYGHLKAQRFANKKGHPEPQQKSARKKTLSLNIQVQKLLLGYHIPDIKHPDIPAILVFQSILGNGKSSRLYKALVEKGISSSVDTYGLDDRDPSLFLISSNLQDGKKAVVAEGVILTEIGRLRDKLVDPNELERAKNKIDFDFYQGLESNYLKAQFLGTYETVADDFRVALKHHTKMIAVSAKDVQRVARQYFNPNTRNTIAGVQK